jgi:hypothetical protein
MYPPYSDDYRRKLQSLFATLAARIHEDWADPAKLGPPVSDRMTVAERDAARKALLNAESQCAVAIRLEREGKVGEALKAWRTLFGPLFPLS